MTSRWSGEHGPELRIERAFAENLHPRGTGALGGQFVAAGSSGAAGQAAEKRARKKIQPGRKPGDMAFDGKRGTGYGTPGGDKRVKALQTALNKLGLTDSAGKALKVDGKLGPKTTAAIKKAQRKLGLKADGVVTPALLAKLTKAKSLTKAKAAPAPAKKAQPTPREAAPRRAAPKRSGKGGDYKAPARTVQVGRSVGYSECMTDLERHGTHNQKSHGNRLGRPHNVAGKTGLAKQAGKLSTQPEHGPERAPKGRTFTKAELRDTLNPDSKGPYGATMTGDTAHQRLIDAGATPEQADQITKDLGFNPGRPWETKELGYKLYLGAEDEAKQAHEEKRRASLAAATPAAYDKLLGTNGAEPLIKSKPMQKVFSEARAAGWTMTDASGHGGYTFSSPDGEQSLNILTINGVSVYDSRHNKISGTRAMALVDASRKTGPAKVAADLSEKPELGPIALDASLDYSKGMTQRPAGLTATQSKTYDIVAQHGEIEQGQAEIAHANLNSLRALVRKGVLESRQGTFRPATGPYAGQELPTTYYRVKRAGG